MASKSNNTKRGDFRKSYLSTWSNSKLKQFIPRRRGGTAGNGSLFSPREEASASSILKARAKNAGGRKPGAKGKAKGGGGGDGK